MSYSGRLCVRYTDLCLTIKQEIPYIPYFFLHSAVRLYIAIVTHNTYNMLGMSANGPTGCCVLPLKVKESLRPVSHAPRYTVQLNPFKALPK